MKKLFFILAMVVLIIGSVYAAPPQLTKPNGGEQLCKGSHFNITWTYSDATPLKLVLFQNGTNTGKIAENLPANTTSYNWTVGNYMGGTALAGTGYIIRVRTMDNGPYDDSNAPFTLLGGSFALTAPNGAESWELGSTQDITWSPGCAFGSVRLDLYKGGINIENKIGIITTNTPVATGKYSWKVGALIGTSAQIGDNYRIVVGSYTPAQKDASNGPFALVKGKLQIGPAGIVKCLELTYPRRGDRLHKGTGYTIKWTTGCFKDAKLKLDLLKIDGTTLVQKIGENLANNGQLLWAVPVLELPDDGLYKMRIQTMDGKNSDTVGPFSIVKAESPAGPPAIKVVAPGGPSQLAIGMTHPIRWTSTCGKSANGPIDDGFTIDLMNAAGSNKIANLLDGVASYDGEHPNGVHNWHWDWPISAGPGKYRIRVTNWSGHCVGTGEQFQLVYSQEYNEYTIILQPAHNCCNVLSWCCAGEINPTDLDAYYLQGGAPIFARVGFRFFTNNTSGAFTAPAGIFLNIVLRSKLSIPDRSWYKDKGHVMSAKMRIERKWKMPNNVATFSPCLGGVVMLSQDAVCVETPSQNPASLPSMPGTVIPVNASQGDVWEVDLTQQYSNIVEHNKPDYGFMLYPAVESYQCPGDWCVVTNAESYKVTLTFRFAKDIKP